MSSYGRWQNFSGAMTLWKIRWWGWDGQSSATDQDDDVIESLNTLFIHGFTEEHVKELIAHGYQIELKKIESIVYGSEDEEHAFDSGWSEGWDAREQKVRNAKPRRA